MHVSGVPPKKYLLKGDFGKHAVEWVRLLDPSAEEIGGLSGAFYQHRLAVAVRDALEQLKITERGLARNSRWPGNR